MKKYFLILIGLFFAFVNVYSMDVEDDPAVNKMVENKIMVGDENGLRLDDPIKRSELLAMIVRIKFRGMAEYDASVNHYDDWLMPYIFAGAGVEDDIRLCTCGFLHFKEYGSLEAFYEKYKIHEYATKTDFVNYISQLFVSLPTEENMKYPEDYDLDFLESSGYDADLFSGINDDLITRREACKLLLGVDGLEYENAWGKHKFMIGN